MRARAPWIDVKKGRVVWTRARVPAEVAVEGRELVLRVEAWRELSKKDRSAVQRLMGSKALGALRAGQEAELRVSLGDARIAAPRIPLMGRATIRVQREGEPSFLVSWLDTSETDAQAEATGLVSLGAIFRLVARGPAARRRRDALVAEIERASGAG